jgi:hypothetical protein
VRVIGEIDRIEPRQHRERSHRPLDFEIDGGGNRSDPLDVLRFDQRLLLTAGRPSQPRGESGERRGGHEDQCSEDETERDPPHAERQRIV